MTCLSEVGCYVEEPKTVGEKVLEKLNQQKQRKNRETRYQEEIAGEELRDER